MYTGTTCLINQLEEIIFIMNKLIHQQLIIQTQLAKNSGFHRLQPFPANNKSAKI